MSILIASGVNLDLLGLREPHIYGAETLKDMESLLRNDWPRIQMTARLPKMKLEFFQTNDEAVLLNKLTTKWTGIVINPGAWTHTSIALRDRLLAIGVPYVEAHLSNVARREEFRQHSFIAEGAVGTVQGFGICSYLIGLEGLARHLRLARAT